eukprot:s9_g10.t1
MLSTLRTRSECVCWGTSAAKAVLQIFGTDLGAHGWSQLASSCESARISHDLIFPMEAVGVSAEIERVEIFGLKSALKSAEVTSAGKVAALPPPRSRPLDSSALQAAVIKVKPFIDMRSEWQLSVMAPALMKIETHNGSGEKPAMSKDAAELNDFERFSMKRSSADNGSEGSDGTAQRGELGKGSPFDDLENWFGQAKPRTAKRLR